MSAVKHAFEKVGHGIEHAVESVGKDLKGVGEVVGGCLTFNPKEIKNGISDVGNGLKEGISGLGEVAGGVAGGIVGITPIGAAINAMTGDKLSNFVEGVGEGCASVLNTGIDGIGEVGSGLANGDISKMLKGMMDVGQVAALAVPGLGEADLAADVAMGAVRGLAKKGVENEVFGG